MIALTKVSDWEWTLYRIDYSAEEDGEVALTKHIVSTPEHIEGDVCGEGDSRWPNDRMKWVEWTALRRTSQPAQVGTLHGLPLSESGWETARKLMKRVP